MKSIIKDSGSVYGSGLGWNALKTVIETLKPSSIFILTDANTEAHCLPIFIERSELNIAYSALQMPAGETFKTIETCVTLWNQLSELGADRASLLINLGGGVVTDLGGFVAATFRRGIACINIPTSLLAMVDASVGGKNGVDLGVLKNQVGIIRAAECVIVDPLFLNTLPKAEIKSGMAEMFKHGLIASEDYWKRMQHFSVHNTEKAFDLIWQSVSIKNEIVTKDPFEKNLRKSLNYGHTLGHAIESYCLESPNNPTLLHGEAIAIGMILATYISSEMLHFPKTQCNNITKTLLDHFRKQRFTEADIQTIITLLAFDKKNSHGVVYFVLLEEIGVIKTNQEVSDKLIRQAFSYYENF